MKAHHIVAIIAISFIAGMFGGTFSERVFANPQVEDKIPEQILAHAFHLVDKKNVRRGSMAFSVDGHPILCVNDQTGKPRGYLGCGPEGPTLVMLDQQSRVSLAMAVGNDGNSTLGLMGAGDMPRVAMDYKPGRGPGLALFDEDNVAKVTMAIAKGKPIVALFRADKEPSVAMLYDPNSGPFLGFLNSRNEAKAGFGLMNDKPLLFAYRPDDTGLLFNIQRDGRPALGLLTEGRPEWSATGTVPQMPALDGILDQVLR